eukprot:1159828-Pelagomonas_calceolata.AAC.13
MSAFPWSYVPTRSLQNTAGCDNRGSIRNGWKNSAHQVYDVSSSRAKSGLLTDSKGQSESSGSEDVHSYEVPLAIFLSGGLPVSLHTQPKTLDTPYLISSASSPYLIVQLVLEYCDRSSLRDALDAVG